MKNKKKVEGFLFAIAVHMQGCSACVESLLRDKNAVPSCAEYQRLKAAAKKLADR